MKLTRQQFKAAVKKAYNIGYDDCANQVGYNIAVLQLGIDPKKNKRPKHVTKYNLLQRALIAAEGEKGE